MESQAFLEPKPILYVDFLLNWVPGEAGEALLAPVLRVVLLALVLILRAVGSVASSVAKEPWESAPNSDSFNKFKIRMTYPTVNKQNQILLRKRPKFLPLTQCFYGLNETYIYG